MSPDCIFIKFFYGCRIRNQSVINAKLVVSMAVNNRNLTEFFYESFLASLEIVTLVSSTRNDFERFSRFEPSEVSVEPTLPDTAILLNLWLKVDFHSCPTISFQLKAEIIINLIPLRHLSKLGSCARILRNHIRKGKRNFNSHVQHQVRLRKDRTSRKRSSRKQGTHQTFFHTSSFLLCNCKYHNLKYDLNVNPFSHLSRVILHFTSKSAFFCTKKCLNNKKYNKT